MTAARVARLAGPAVAAALLMLLVAGCSPGETTFTTDQVDAAQLSADQLAALGGTPSTTDPIGPYTAADLVATAGSPDVVDPESCRDYVMSLAVPGQVILPAQDAASTDPVVVAPHLDLDSGFIERVYRVLPDAATATRLVADLRALATSCSSFDYGSATDVNRFSTVATGDLPFDGDGYLSTIVVKGTKYVVETDEIYVMRFGNVVATVRGTGQRTQAFAQAVSDNLRAQH